MINNKLADDFTMLYSDSKTLRFELKPIGATKDFIEKVGILDTDFHRNSSYKRVKKIIDEYHKEFIETSLTELELSGLEEYYQLYSLSKRDARQESEFKKVQDSLRKQIVKCFTANPRYKNLFKKDLIKTELVAFTEQDKESQELVKEFEEFTTYFDGFHKNRKNMYTDEEKSTAIAYRLIHQNLPKYIDNMKVYAQVKESELNETLDVLLSDLQKKTDIRTVDEYFELSGFNKVLNQTGIDTYNVILGAYSSEGNVKVKGLNEYINLHNQQQGKNKKNNIPILKPLFKQILSDREKVSFIPEQFTTDFEVIQAIKEYCENIRLNILENTEQVNIGNLLSDLSQFDLNRVYVHNDNSITTISNALFGNWAYISNAINSHYDRQSAVKNKNTAKYADAKKRDLKNIKNYAIGELNDMLADYSGEECHIENYFAQEVQQKIQQIDTAYGDCKALLNCPESEMKSLRKNDSDVALIKKLLDAFKELLWLVKPLLDGQMESDKDEMFYGEFLRIWEELDAVTPLYNKVRNYVTRKPYSLEKVKLNFDRSTLLDGWDKNKENANLGIIMIKDDLYYLGIMNPKWNKIMDQAPQAKSNNIYKKMEYKLLPGPNKMLPKVFFSKSRIEEFNPSEEIINNYKQQTHIKGENFNLDDCHKLIDFYKESIKKHEDWSQFQFQFSDTQSYADISGFYREVEHQGYKITFKDIDAEYVDDLVKQGKLYLFQIYNKDFSPYSKGKPNLHTLYWKMLFSPENLKNVVYKLNGQAEIFYRKASIAKDDIICHKAGLQIPNKSMASEKTGSTFDYDIIKDKRFTCDKFQFHVPITLNFQAGNSSNINLKVNQAIHDADNLSVIGIDRGERNLLYITVIDMQGNIKEQMSLNEIISYNKKNIPYKTDYYKLLDGREEKNKEARKNWQTINTIKELKEGYLSQAIHVIVQLLMKYNAIIVLEDLNFGFMRGRQKVEKQVYQKFEKMLIQKLSYLVDKDKEPDEKGGLLNAYQLTNKFESFKRLGKQSGFLYYVPAWNTSKIDPTTGFVNLFYTKYESVEKTRDFIKKLDAVYYDKAKGYFVFSFDYSKFTYKADETQLKWEICTKGNRIENYRNPEKNNEWDTQTIDLTEELKNLFTEYDIVFTDGDLKDKMMEIGKADFYKKFLRIFSLILQMRNSDSKNNIDQLVSPVLNHHGEFFVSGTKEGQPLDADANGAYNIARKGLWIIEQIKKTKMEDLDKLKLSISNKEWLQYAQEHLL